MLLNLFLYNTGDYEIVQLVIDFVTYPLSQSCCKYAKLLQKLPEENATISKIKQTT